MSNSVIGWSELADDPMSPDRPVTNALRSRPVTNALRSSAVALSNIASAAANAAAQVFDTALRPAEQDLLHEKASEVTAPSIAPWQTLGEQFSILEEELRARIMHIPESESNFSEQVAKQHTAFCKSAILPGCGPMANAALEQDSMLRELRFRMVPSRISEEAFWRSYFWHVANVKMEMLHDWKTANSGVADGATASSAASAVSTDDLDAEFERLVGSPSAR